MPVRFKTVWQRTLRSLIVSAALMFGVICTGVAQSAKISSPQTPLIVDGPRFLLRGKPFQILSGEVEYARIPRADWRDRLRKVRALGLNTITVYAFWDLHEPKRGIYDFSGQNDVAKFLREAQQEGLYVILRPGPYVCAEWDLGGYPSWLLKDHALVLRSSQEIYLKPVRMWMKRLGEELAPLQASRGGPIIAVQVENEYGSFQVPDDGGEYLRKMKQIVIDSGFSESLLYTADGGDQLPKGSLPGVFAAVDYGTGDSDHSISQMKAFRPNAPVYAAEYWDGWFDHWGEKHQLTDAAMQESEIRSVIEKGYSINLYMVHGGTSFGWMNGANSGDAGYQPDVSSYDYDAPIDEAGRPRPKYFALRKMIAEVTHQTPPPVPDSAPLMALPALHLTESASLWSALPKSVHVESPLSMEDLDQAYGYILYRTKIVSDLPEDTSLHFDALHSYARVYLDGHLTGVVDRRLGQSELKLTAKTGQQLDILVENGGRINFTTKIRGERAGILGNVKINGEVLHGFDIVPLPLNGPPSDGYSSKGCSGPCFFRGELPVTKVGDTFLNTATLGKGVVWVNGHLLGRYWNVGPMGSLFLPGAWLHEGANAITVMDLNGGEEIEIRAEDHPTYLDPGPERTTAAGIAAEPVLLGTTPNPAIVPTDRLAENWWKQRHEAVLRDVSAHPDTQLLLIGDSITNNYDKATLPDENFQPTWKTFYEPRRALNLGFSGDTTANVLWRLDHGEVAGLHPKAAMILIGTNNTGFKSESAEQTEVGIDAVIADLEKRLPDTKILLLAVLPSDLSEEKTAADRAVNHYLANSYSENPRVTYLDISSIFYRKGMIDASIFYDPRLPQHGKALHPDTNGQRMMAEAVEPTLAKLMGDDPKVSLGAMAEINTALIPVPKLEQDSYDWFGRHHAEMDTKQRMNPSVVMIGDSITHFWGGLPNANHVNGSAAWQHLFKADADNILNLGFGWDRTQNVLWRLRQGEFDGLTPRAIVLMIGTNNLTASNNARANTPEEIVVAIEAICAELRSKSPDTRLIVMAVLPRGRLATDPLRASVAATNRLLAERFASDASVTYLDIGAKFISGDGALQESLMPDGTHPSEAGYSIWADALAESFHKLGAKP